MVTISITLKTHDECNGLIAPDAVVSFAVKCIMIAVTAKAMKGDREKCIEAGAWDYLSKPVDTEQMLAVLRAWLHR